MTRSPFVPVSSVLVSPVLASLLCGGCVIELTGDGDGGSSGDQPPSTITSPVPGTTNVGGDATDDGTTGGTTDAVTTVTPDGTADSTGPGDTGDPTGGPMGDCTPNLLGDPGFEEGTPNPSWDEDSLVFNAVICDASCTEEEGAAPYAGDYWVWLGGIDDEPEVGSIRQTVTLEPETAFLRFWFQIRSGSGTGDDVFTVTLDGDTVFMATDLDMPSYAGEYRRVEVDVSPWADGGDHELAFTGEIAGAGLTSFFVDETSLVTCVPEGGSSSGSDSGSGSGGTTMGSSTGATETGSGSSGSGTGGSSGSTG